MGLSGGGRGGGVRQTQDFGLDGGQGHFFELGNPGERANVGKEDVGHAEFEMPVKYQVKIPGRNLGELEA